MKKAAYILGIIGSMIIFLGSMFKVMHWPGASILLVIGIAGFIFCFLPVALIHHYRTSSENKDIWLHIVTFLTGMVVFTSALFKIMHWHGAGVLMIFAVPFPFVIFLPVFFYTSKKNKASIREYSYILMMFLLYALTSSLLAVNISKDLVDDGIVSCKEWTNIEKVSMLGECTIMKQSKTSNDPKIAEFEKIHSAADALIDEINQFIQKLILDYTPDSKAAIDPLKQLHYDLLFRKDAIVSTEKYFLPGEIGFQMKSHLIEFREMLVSTNSVKNEDLNVLIKKLLSTTPKSDIAWEEFYLSKQPLIWEINTLQSLKASVRFCEYELMKTAEY